jgi:L-ascorbate metabolism protein UlaG (beta-lactamase superfamily)
MSAKITWLGHSGFILETTEHTILIDPFLTGNPLAPFQANSLKADFILLTHGHGDHVGDTVSIAKRTGATVVGNFEVGNWIKAQGVANVATMNTGGSGKFAFGNLKLTLAFHSSSMPDGSYGGSPNGLTLKLNNGLVIHHCGDTALFSDMQIISEDSLDLVMVPIGDYFTMGPRDSIRAIQWLAPEYVIPVHYNTFPPIAQDAGAWADMVSKLTNSKPVVLDPGGSYFLSR